MKGILTTMACLLVMVSLCVPAWAEDETYELFGSEVLAIGTTPVQLDSSVSPVARKVWISFSGQDVRWKLNGTVERNNGVLQSPGSEKTFTASDDYEFKTLNFVLDAGVPLASGATVDALYYR